MIWHHLEKYLGNTCHILACYDSTSTQAELMDIAMRSVLLVPFLIVSLQSEILNFKNKLLTL